MATTSKKIEQIVRELYLEVAGVDLAKAETERQTNEQQSWHFLEWS